MKKMKKVLLSIIIAIAIVLLACSGYKVFATATNEMISFGDGLPSNFPYMTYVNLVEEKDTFCSGRGIHLPREEETYVKSGNQKQSEANLTINDIGKKIFKGEKNTSGYITSESFKNPYSATTSRTHGYYVESDKKVATPAESYVLSEMSENYRTIDSTFYNVTKTEYTGDIESAYVYNISGITFAESGTFQCFYRTRIGGRQSPSKIIRKAPYRMKKGACYSSTPILTVYNEL